ncbi:MAG: hypothetical protein V1820_05175 [archaeon]
MVKLKSGVANGASRISFYPDEETLVITFPSAAERAVLDWSEEDARALALAAVKEAYRRRKALGNVVYENVVPLSPIPAEVPSQLVELPEANGADSPAGFQFAFGGKVCELAEYEPVFTSETERREHVNRLYRERERKCSGLFFGSLGAGLFAGVALAIAEKDVGYLPLGMIAGGMVATVIRDTFSSEPRENDLNVARSDARAEKLRIGARKLASIPYRALSPDGARGGQY